MTLSCHIPPDKPFTHGEIMSTALITALLSKPTATPAELGPDAQAWVDRFFGKHVDLVETEPFFLQVANHPELSALSFEATPWDPYDEGYDDGPDNLNESWYTDETVSTGQYAGIVVECENVFDKLGAALLALSDPDEPAIVDEDDAIEFLELLQLDWSPPLSQEQRDRVVMADIRAAWTRLSVSARAELIQELVHLTDKYIPDHQTG